MNGEHHFLAIDLGAESGRAELVSLADGMAQMREVHRFANRSVMMGGTLYWDFPGLFGSVLDSLTACAALGVKLSGIAVDTWGVDFGLLGRDGALLGNPVCYRDRRTNGMQLHAGAIMSLDEIFQATALHTLPINTLFQLHAMQQAKSVLLDAAHTFLMMPDLVNYLLTGRRRCELTDAQTSQLVGADGRWSARIIGAFRLRRELFPEMIEPGTSLGPLLDDVRRQTGIGGEVPVIATASHDTAAAVAAVPGQGDNWAFLSCGTWSILGKCVHAPIASRRCHECRFTNEYTLDGWYLGRNIIGLWLVQQLRRKWDKPDDRWDYERLTACAAGAADGWSGLVDMDSPSLLAPPDMEETLLSLLKDSGQGQPADRGQLVRCVLESLALHYAWAMDVIGELTLRRPEALYVVGGGAANELLCQLTADACGVVVHAGVEQCTAMGNALVQAVAVGALKDRSQIAQVMRDSFTLKLYEPREADLWADKKQQYLRLIGRG